MSTIHIESDKEKIAELVLMPGDPNRAKFIADNFLENVELINQRRGELGFTGFYKNKKITVFSSGMGIPSMGIYSYELFNDYDVKTIIRIGTAKGEDSTLNVGDLFLITESFSNSNYDKEMLNRNVGKISSGEEINNLILETSNELDLNLKSGTTYTSEAFYSKNDKELIKNNNISVTEMECYSLFLNAKILNKQAGAIVTITDTENDVLDPVLREKNLNKMITLALETIIKL